MQGAGEGGESLQTKLQARHLCTERGKNEEPGGKVSDCSTVPRKIQSSIRGVLKPKGRLILPEWVCLSTQRLTCGQALARGRGTLVKAWQWVQRARGRDHFHTLQPAYTHSHDSPLVAPHRSPGSGRTSSMGPVGLLSCRRIT